MTVIFFVLPLSFVMTMCSISYLPKYVLYNKSTTDFVDNAQGVSKGIVVQNLISTMSREGRHPDFVLCIGDDRSDEDMFESIASAVNNPSLPAMSEVFACTVGQKPSKAKYYLDDTVDVIKMLQGLASASIQPPKYTHLQVSFEGSL